MLRGEGEFLVPKTCWDFIVKFSQMYIMGCYCWDLLPPAWLDAGLLHGYCPSTYLLLQVHCGDVSKRQQETNFWNQFREWWIKNSNHTCPRLCKILAKEKGKCLQYIKLEIWQQWLTTNFYFSPAAATWKHVILFSLPWIEHKAVHSKENYREPSTLNLWNLGWPANDLY